jgi:hypothetical protein
VREGMVLQGGGPEWSCVRCPHRVRARVTLPPARFGDKVASSTIVTYDIDQRSLAWWLGEPELRRVRAWREEPPGRATQAWHGADDVAA